MAQEVTPKSRFQVKKVVGGPFAARKSPVATIVLVGPSTKATCLEAWKTRIEVHPFYSTCEGDVRRLPLGKT